MNSGFVYESAEQAEAAFAGEADNFVYARYGNPSLKMVETRLAALEGAEACRVCATGMAAVFSVLASQLQRGDRLVASQALFGACHAIITKILPRWGIETELVEGTDLQAWEKALARPCQLVFLETPSNPLLHLVDVQAVCEMAHGAGARIVVDNVFATPLYQKPLELGADIVVYSTTKHIDGHGRSLGGAVLGREEFVEGEYLPFYRQTGAAMSPFNAWLVLKSLESLSVRVEAMSKTAAMIAERLADTGYVKNLSYPGHASHPQYALACTQMSGFGSLLAFEIETGKAGAFAFLNGLKLIDISNNLGDAKSLACHPATTTHANLSDEDRHNLGITDGHVRLSIGLEDGDDLWADIEQAFGGAFEGAFGGAFAGKP